MNAPPLSSHPIPPKRVASKSEGFTTICPSLLTSCESIELHKSLNALWAPSEVLSLSPIPIPYETALFIKDFILLFTYVLHLSKMFSTEPLASSLESYVTILLLISFKDFLVLSTSEQYLQLY